MKKFLIEYINTIGYVLTGLIFGFACFLLFLNLYHSKEVANQYVKVDTAVDVYTKNQDKINQIKKNAASFNSNQYRGSADQLSLLSVKSNLDMCVAKFQQTEANALFAKKEISVLDVYQLLNYYQSDIVNDCITLQIYSISSSGNSTKMKLFDTVQPFVQMNSKMLMNDLNYVKRVLQSNSSYFFSSDYDKVNVFHMIRDSYTRIEASYQYAVDLVYEVSEWFRKVVGGEIS